MLKIIVLFVILLLILIFKRRLENFDILCNVPYRVSSICYNDKYHHCINDLQDTTKCQKLAMAECIPPTTVSSFFSGKISCV